MFGLKNLYPHNISLPSTLYLLPSKNLYLLPSKNLYLLPSKNLYLLPSKKPLPSKKFFYNFFGE